MHLYRSLGVPVEVLFGISQLQLGPVFTNLKVPSVQAQAEGPQVVTPSQTMCPRSAEQLRLKALHTLAVHEIAGSAPQSALQNDFRVPALAKSACSTGAGALAQRTGAEGADGGVKVLVARKKRLSNTVIKTPPAGPVPAWRRGVSAARSAL